MTTTVTTINGTVRSIAAGPQTPLIDVLRNDLGLVGTRFGCGSEACGACLVLVDGAARHACTLPLEGVAGREVVTVEGLGTPRQPHPIQQAFLALQAGQCGYCLSGVMIAAAALLAKNPAPTRGEIAGALDGCLCRCGAHGRMLAAVEQAAAMIRTGARA
jgi:nicotinate dehydrogenase subunit A